MEKRGREPVDGEATRHCGQPVMVLPGTVYQRPACHQGTHVVPGDEPLPNIRPRVARPELQRMELSLLARLNRTHLERRAADQALDARIRSFETAFGMQREAPEAFDQKLEEESKKPISYWQELLDTLTPPSTDIMLIASKEKEPIGLVFGFNKGEGIGSFGGMWVAKSDRKEGVASSLVEAILNWAKNSGINTLNIWNMEGNYPAQKLYEKFGFRPTGLSKSLDAEGAKIIIQLRKNL